jgi:DNA-directed RNA polymerase specialized sigma subunit
MQQLKPIDDQLEPLTRWQGDPSPDNGRELLKSISPVLDQGVRRFGGSASGPAMRTQAKLIAFDAAKKYDARLGVPFKAYLMSNLQGLRRFSGQETAVVRVPERAKMEVDRLNKAEAILSDQLGRDPSVGELSDYLSISPQKVQKIRSTVGGAVPESTMPDAGTVSSDTDDVWRRYVYNSLSPQLQNIMEHTLGMNGKPILSTAELARRRRISPSAVSQQKARIQAILDSTRMGG